MVGKAITEPYFMKCLKVKFTPCSSNRFVNMIPARAPIGVRKAPILLPTIEA